MAVHIIMDVSPTVLPSVLTYVHVCVVVKGRDVSEVKHSRSPLSPRQLPIGGLVFFSYIT